MAVFGAKLVPAPTGSTNVCVANTGSGELVVEDTFGSPRIKLPAGDMVLYPSSSVHRVEPVTRGARICCFSWMQSMVRETERRRLLYEMDMSLMTLRQAQGDSPSVVTLTSCYHNLLRIWAEV